jgi:hypothetical protein
MVGRNVHDTRAADRLGRRRITGARERMRLGVAAASGQYIDHRLLAREGDPVKLDPAVDHDEEGGRRIPLSKQDLMRRQRDCSGRRDDVRDGIWLEPSEHRDTADDLQIPDGRIRGHVSLAERNFGSVQALLPTSRQDTGC